MLRTRTGRKNRERGEGEGGNSQHMRKTLLYLKQNPNYNLKLSTESRRNLSVEVYLQNETPGVPTFRTVNPAVPYTEESTVLQNYISFFLSILCRCTLSSRCDLNANLKVKNYL